MTGHVAVVIIKPRHDYFETYLKIQLSYGGFRTNSTRRVDAYLNMKNWESVRQFLCRSNAIWLPR